MGRHEKGHERHWPPMSGMGEASFMAEQSLFSDAGTTRMLWIGVVRMHGGYNVVQLGKMERKERKRTMKSRRESWHVTIWGNFPIRMGRSIESTASRQKIINIAFRDYRNTVQQTGVSFPVRDNQQ